MERALRSTISAIFLSSPRAEAHFSCVPGLAREGPLAAGRPGTGRRGYTATGLPLVGHQTLRTAAAAGDLRVAPGIAQGPGGWWMAGPAGGGVWRGGGGSTGAARGLRGA